MSKNKVIVSVNGVETLALVDTGAAVSVMSLSFKNRLGHKVMFACDRNVHFRGVGGEHLRAIGVCSATVTLGEEAFRTEFIVLAQATHDVILGIDFLRDSGATLDCGTGEISFRSEILPTPIDDPSETSAGVLSVAEDTLLPAMAASFIPVNSARFRSKSCTILIEGDANNMVKKNILVPRALVEATDGRSHVWTVNASSEPVVLPCGFKIASFDEQVNVAIQAVNHNPDHTTTEKPDYTAAFKRMINNSLSSVEQCELLKTLAPYASTFDFAQGDHSFSVPASRLQHRINTGDATPIRQKPYRVSPSERKIINDQAQEMLSKGVIRESSSPWAAPVILVKKKDNSWRFCVDYRRLNAVTKKDVYPLPRIDDAIDCLHSASYFSSLDLRSGYWQIPVHPSDKEKTAFVTPDGLFEFNVMPFGLCNAPATFERFMDTILRGLKWEICMCYLDDIIIYGTTFSEHNQRLGIVLDRIQKAGLVLNSKKCHFAERQAIVLGFLVDKDGIRPDPQKISAVRGFVTPRSLKDLRSFLGLCSYFRRFIKDFAQLSHPLNCLLQKDTPFVWTPECEAAFQQLKFLLTSSPVLRHFNPAAPTELHTDASGVGVGAVLVQLNSGAQHVIAYASRTLTKAERNYTVTELECLAVIFAVQKFRPYLYGRHFSIITDHHSLCWLVGLRDPSGRLARWALRLQEYDFSVSYKSGRRHTDADCLSRLPVPAPPCDDDHFDDCLASLSTAIPTASNLKEEQLKDSSLKTMFDAAQRAQPSCPFVVRDGLLFKRNYSVDGARFLLVVPASLRAAILHATHDDPTAGHLGFVRTLHRLKQNFYWPGMRRFAKQYVAGCLQCQRHKRPGSPSPGPLHPVTPPTSPFEQVGIDLLGPLPKSSTGHRWIIVCVDYLTRYVETASLVAATAEDVSAFLLHSVILRHGAPRVIISDRGRQFTADVLEELLRLCGSVSRHSTAYHPQTNGLTERTNRTLTNMLSMYVTSDQKNWDTVLPFVTYAYNTAKHEITGYAPFFLLYVRAPRTFLDSILPFSPHHHLSLAQTLCRAEEARRLSRIRTLSSQARTKARYDDRHPPVAFTPGEQVWLWTPVRKKGLHQKFLSTYSGPFVVLSRFNDVNYVVAKVTSNGRRSSRTQVVHVARLKRCHSRTP